MNLVVVYSYIVVYGKINPVFNFDSYQQLANDIVGEYERLHPDIQSTRKYLEHVKNQLSGEEQMRSYREFERNFYSWLKRRDLI